MNIEQLLRSKFREVRRGRGRNGTEYKIACPWCGGKWKMYINPTFKGGVYNCYKCDQSGPLRSLVAEFKSDDAPAAPVRDEPLPTDIDSPGITVPLTDLSDDNMGIQYLTNVRKRAFDPIELSRDYGVRYCTQGKEYRLGETVYNTTNTLIFPVWMFDRLVGWQSRLLFTPDTMEDWQLEAFGYTKDENDKWLLPPKYLTNPGFSKGRVLWNFDKARKWKFVVAQEGVFDGMSTGGPSVATFGTGISNGQANLLKEYWEAVIVLLDPDGTAGQVQELVGKLRRAVTVVPVMLSGGFKDPGDTPREEIWRQIVVEIDKQIIVRNTLALQDLRTHIHGGI